MIFIDLICPMCNLHKLGSNSTSRRAKHTFKTCGSKECSAKSKALNHKCGSNFIRTIQEYSGTKLCEYDCGSYARYQFKSGKLCCSSVASNCAASRKDINYAIAQRLKTSVDENGISKTQLKANKTADTKRSDIDEFGRDGFARFSDKLKLTIQESRDENGRTYLSRSKITDEEFFAKPEKDRYYILVWEETNRQWYKHFNDIPDAKLRSVDHHLDHNFSISEGFKQKIPVHIIGHYSNLRIITASKNCSKRGDCHKTVKQLYEDYTRLELALTSSNVISLNSSPSLNTV
jgi:hypothetical protein